MSDAKLIRGQIRQIAKELLPEMIKAGLIEAIKKDLLATLTERLNIIDERQKDIQGYIVRQTARTAPALEPKKD